MRINRSWRIKPAQILLGVTIVILLVAVRGTSAGNKPVHLTTDWSHRHLVFSAPKSLGHHIRLLSNPRYVQQGIRRNAEHKGGGDAERWRRAGTVPQHGDWSMYMGYGGDPTNIVPGTVGAGNYPAKFSFDATSANCETPAPPAGQQPDFVVYNTSLAGTNTPVSALDTGTVTAEPGPGDTIVITIYGNKLTLTAGTITSTTGAGAGTFIRDSDTTIQAANIKDAINLSGNGSYVGATATSVGNVLTVASTATGFDVNYNNTVDTGSTTNVSVVWSFNRMQDGADAIASILAFDNLYLGCNGDVPGYPPYWAYATGGQVVTSPTLSGDGTQVAFVQNSGGAASLVVLKWAAHTGTVGYPVVLNN